MLYQLLIRLFAPLIWLLMLSKRFKEGDNRFLAQRFGLGYRKAPQDIWLHCASVGEVKAAEALIHQLKDSQKLLITTNTPTGAALVEQLFGHQVQHVYLPLDWPYAIRRFLKAYHPKTLWVMETELWPNLYRLSAKHGLSVYILNARLSKKTLSSPAWLQRTYQRTLAHVTQVLARDEEEAKRFEQLGMPTEHIQVLGNLKYAGLVDLPEFARPIERDYVLAASTHKQEELDILQQWQALHRDELLVIVPRHPKRRDDILQQLKDHRDHLAVFSLDEAIQTDTRYYLDDQIGVLMPLYAHAKLVIMGGAFAPKGGHNVLEPAALKASIITGADMSDFESETALLKEYDAIRQLNDISELSATLTELLNHPEEREKMGQNAFNAICTRTHILQHYLEQLQPSYIDKSH